MLRIFSRRPGLGLEITSSALRLAAVSGRREQVSVSAIKTVDLPAGMVGEGYASLNVRDTEGFSDALRTCLDSAGGSGARRVAVSLPDGVFRVQTFEFDELPPGGADRERLIRWRLEKAAAFDMSDTVIKYQVFPRPDKGLTVLSCTAKRDVISQYETALTGLGFEPWTIGISSFNTLNFYAPSIKKKGISGFAFACVAEGSFTTIVVERGGPRFYRSKELKAGPAEDIRPRLVRELDDSIHFYLHMDRQTASEVGHLYLSGPAASLSELAEGLKGTTSLEIETLDPSLVLPISADQPATMVAAIGAGGAL